MNRSPHVTAAPIIPLNTVSSIFPAIGGGGIDRSISAVTAFIVVCRRYMRNPVSQVPT